MAGLGLECGVSRFPRRWALVLALLAVGLLVLLVSGSGAGQVYANDLTDDGVACWVTGNTSGSHWYGNHNDRVEGGWGSDYEYSLDKNYFWGIVNQALALDEEGVVPEASRPNEQEYYRSLSEAVDVAFASYWEDFQHYGQLEGRYPDAALYVDTYELLNYGTATHGWTADQKSSSVIDRVSGYLERRAVALYAEDRVQGYVARWYDPWNPEGGYSVDLAGLSKDQQSLMNAMVQNTASYVTSGHRIITGTEDVPAVSISGNLSVNCPAGGAACSVSNVFNSETSTVTVRTALTDQSNAETSGANVDDDSFLPDSNIDVRSRDSAGYSHTRQTDSGEDQIVVLLSLNPEYRQDYYFKVFNDGVQDRILFPGFGSEPWTYKNVAGGLPPSASGVRTDSQDAGHRFVGTGDPVYDWGYRQPTLGVAWDEGAVAFGAAAQDFLRRGGLGARYAGGILDPGRAGDYESDGSELSAAFFAPNGTAHNLAQQWRQIRWPVNFEELNWYLYELPGRADAVGGDDASWLAYWMTEEGYAALLGSGYLREGILSDNALEGDGCYFIDHEGAMQGGEAFRVRGQAECDDAVYTAGDRFNKGELTGGNNYDNNSGVFPFQKVRESAVSPSGPAYGLDYQAYSVRPWHEIRSVDDTLGVGRWGYLAQPKSRAMGVGNVANDEAVLVKAGVESPIDVDMGGPRQLSSFQFVINEQVDLGSSSVVARGREGLDSFGVPGNQALMASYMASWPSQPIDPNRVYMLVVTFYEVYQGGADPNDDDLQQYDLVYAIDGDDADDIISDVGYRLPERRIRRVICRMAVLPPGFVPTSSEGGGLFGFVGEALSGTLGGAASFVWNSAPVSLVRDTIHGARQIAGVVGDVFSGGWKWLGDFFASLMRIPTDVAGVGIGAGCEAVSAADTVLTDGAAASESDVLVRSDGTFIKNTAARSRTEIEDFCEETSAPALDQEVCGITDSAYRGGCEAFPRMKLELVADEFSWHDPGADGVTFKNARSGSEDRAFVAALNESRYSAGEDPLPNNLGLTRVAVNVETRVSSLKDEAMEGVEGYMYEVDPDPKVWGDNLVYLVPRYVRVRGIDSGGSEKERNYLADQFSFGDLELADDVELGEADWVRPASVRGASVSGLGSSGQVDHTEKFVNLLRKMPVAPGFTHRFRVALYGVNPDGESIEGRWSDWLTVDGNTAACSVAASANFNDFNKTLYGCPGVDALPSRPGIAGDTSGGYGGGVLLASAALPALAQTGAVSDSSLRLGLVDLSGTELCGDFFTTSPPKLTWDNTVVKMGWRLVWIIAGSLLFVLFVWQGLSMTYDTWIARQPSTGFRELIPRFVLAVLLAVASYWICKTVLILSSDLGCFVAQVTGMTMWGSLFYTAGAVFEAWQDLIFEADPFAIALTAVAAILLFVKAIILLIPVVFFLAVAIIVWLKVAFSMLTRLVLISCLIVFSPVAFAFYASPATEHWTKKWLSLFMGVVFQQVVVLMVLYIGGALLYDYVYSATESVTAFLRLFIGLFVALATLFIADRVPKIVNPGAQGMFDGYGQMLKMAAAAAITVGSAGAGFVQGAVRGGGGQAVSVPGAITGGGGGSGGGGDAAAAPGSAAPSTGGVGAAGAVAGPTGAVAGFVGNRFVAGLQGMSRGFQQGQARSNRMRDFAEGNFLYRNASFSDDAADARAQQGKKQDEMIALLGKLVKGQQSGGGP